MRMAIRFLALFFLTASVAYAGPERVRFHGTITDLPGVTVVDGNYSFLVRIYDQATGGSLMYSQTVTAYVGGGAYSLDLSPSAPNNPGQLKAAFAEWPRFLDVTVVSGPAGSINEPLLPRQEITSVPFALTDIPPEAIIPVGAIILWAEGPPCPQGYAEVIALRNATVRGADITGANSAVPDVPGYSCPGGPGCEATVSQYNDTLDTAEMPSHTHNARFTNGGGSGGSEDLPEVNDDELANVMSPTAEAGGGQAHYHPFTTVLFCKRQ